MKCSNCNKELETITKDGNVHLKQFCEVNGQYFCSDECNKIKRKC